MKSVWTNSGTRKEEVEMQLVLNCSKLFSAHDDFIMMMKFVDERTRLEKELEQLNRKMK